MYEEVEPGQVPMVHFGGGWLLDASTMTKAPQSDTLEHERLAALIEAEAAAYKEAARMAEEAQHYRELEAAGKGRTMREIFDEQLALEPREQVRRDVAEKRREAAANAPETMAEYIAGLRVKARERRRVLDDANVHVEHREDGTSVTVKGATDAGNLEWAQKQRERRARRDRIARRPR